MVLMPSYDCETCSERQQKDRGCEAQRLFLKDDGNWEWGETGRAPLPHSIGTDLTYWGCPRRMYIDDPISSGYLLDCLGYFNKGFLFEGGGILDQSGVLMEYLSIMASHVHKCEAAKPQNNTPPRTNTGLPTQPRR